MLACRLPGLRGVFSWRLWKNLSLRSPACLSLPTRETSLASSGILGPGGPPSLPAVAAVRVWGEWWRTVGVEWEKKAVYLQCDNFDVFPRGNKHPGTAQLN